MICFMNSERNQFRYQEWILYFAENDAQRLNIDFSKEKGLSKEEKKLIFPSIRAFQKGEGSDGIHLMKTVDEYIRKGGKQEYREAMQWFVKEENWHSAYLKKYMNFCHVKAAKRSFLDRAFRKLRQLGGLKCEITILVTAEMIALTYYDALSKCVDSPALRSICNQMLHDEIPHIMFQSYTLSNLKRSPLDGPVRILIMEITSFLVWCAFHRVYQAGGYRFCQFRKENIGYLRQSIKLSGMGRVLTGNIKREEC